jgi:hypothetical protein
MVDQPIEFFKIIPPRKQSQTAGRAAVSFRINYIVPVKFEWLLDWKEVGRDPTHDGKAVMNGAPRFVGGPPAGMNLLLDLTLDGEGA